MVDSELHNKDSKSKPCVPNTEEFYGLARKLRGVSSENKLRLLSIIKENPGIRGIDLINRLYVESTTIYNHLKILRKYNYVRYVQNGAQNFWYYNEDSIKGLFKEFERVMQFSGDNYDY